MTTPNSKSHVNQMLSQFIGQMADEKTEVVQGGSLEQDILMTKGEALARIIWQMALGWKEHEDLVKDGVVIGKRVKNYPPAQWALKEILDRAEGRAAQVSDTGGTKPTVAERISDRTKNRLNILAEMESVERQDSIIPPIRTVPRHPSREE